MTTFLPSPQQQALFDWAVNGSGSARLDAVAGAGKTTSIIEMLRLIAAPGVSIALAAYNKKIADEITTRVADLGVVGVRAATFHSFGFSAWKTVAPKVKVEERKMKIICAEMNVPKMLESFVTTLVSLAKQRAIGVLTETENTAAWYDIVEHFDLEYTLAEENTTDRPLADLVADGVNLAIDALKVSIARDVEMINFDDMIYAPLVHNAKVWQNDWVLIDEAQDTNPARRALAKRMLKPGGRLVAVGDPHQAIYGFTGADNDSLDLIEREFSCVRLPLTVTYRCPKAVVAVARQLVSHITAHESAPQGTAKTIDQDTFLRHLPRLQPTDAVLCRNTKPLVELAFRMIRAGIGCRVEGRDIGNGLIALAKRWASVTTVGALRDKLEEYAEREVAKLMAKGQEVKAGAIQDKVDTLGVILASLPADAPVSAAVATIAGMFGDSDARDAKPLVTLSTVHKSKGREWARVFLLGRNRYMPSPFARQSWQMEQELNLQYVAITRAKDTLIEITVPLPEKTRRVA